MCIYLLVYGRSEHRSASASAQWLLHQAYELVENRMAQASLAQVNFHVALTRKREVVFSDRVGEKVLVSCWTNSSRLPYLVWQLTCTIYMYIVDEHRYIILE